MSKKRVYFKPEMKKEIVELYKKDYSIVDICEKYDLCSYTVIKILTEYCLLKRKSNS